MYSIVYDKEVNRHLKNLKGAKLLPKAMQLLNDMKADPFVVPPPFKQLRGELAGMYSRRINQKHRIFYAVDEDAKEIHVLSMWNHDFE